MLDTFSPLPSPCLFIKNENSAKGILTALLQKSTMVNYFVKLDCQYQKNWCLNKKSRMHEFSRLTPFYAATLSIPTAPPTGVTLPAFHSSNHTCVRFFLSLKVLCKTQLSLLYNPLLILILPWCVCELFIFTFLIRKN